MPRSSASSSDTSDTDGAVETLVAGREKRQTAGQRLGTLLQNEGVEDDVALLFAENPGDEEADDDFVSHEDAGSENDMGQSGSSEDDDEAGGVGGADDYAGETELQQVERAEKRKRRLQKPGLARGVQSTRRKDPKMPVTAGVQVRDKASQAAPRPLKIQHPASRAANTIDGPVRLSNRKQTVQNRRETKQRFEEESQKRQKLPDTEARSKPEPVAQAVRLAEAAKFEVQNSHHRGSWETEQNDRLKERRAKAAALRDRRLHGPAVTWLSEPALWDDSTLLATGSKRVKQCLVMQAGHEANPVSSETPLQDTDSNLSPDKLLPFVTGGPEAPIKKVVPEARVLPSPDAPPAFRGLSSASDGLVGPLRVATRNLLMTPSQEGRPTYVQGQPNGILLPRKKANSKASKATSRTCLVTGLPARFRDPVTGLAYANSRAFRELRKLAAGKPQWSDLLGCYVGSPA